MAMRRASRRSEAFPVGLYGMLLFALAWLTLPQVFAPLERLLVGAVCVVPRLCSAWLGEPAMAADASSLARIEALGDELRLRVERHDFAGAGIALPAGDEPILCPVLAVERRGGAGLPSELRLDRTYRELDGCRDVVTKGGALLGFLLRPGVGPAIDDEPTDPARVMLCHHRDAPRLFAGFEHPGVGRLNFVVRAAATVDPAPLRVDMWDDPYRAARLEQGGQDVYTLPLQGLSVPAGLALGRTRIWGYERTVDKDALTIAVFVEPPFEPRALSHVVLWRPYDAERSPASRSAHEARRRVAATVYELPGAVRGRHLLVGPARVPEGAAVVQNGLFLGTARGLAFGTGLVTSFAASRHEWSLLFLPAAEDADPVELYARVVGTQGGVTLLECFGPDARDLEQLGDGFLFTGQNGSFCPAGLWIGRVRPHRFERNLLEVVVPQQPGPQRAEVFVEGDAP